MILNLLLVGGILLSVIILKNYILLDEIFEIFEYISLKLRLSIIQFLSLEVTINKETNTMIIPYYFNGVKYHIITLLPVSRGPNKNTIENIEGSSSENNSKWPIYIGNYLGPFKNFHNIPTSPQMMGLNHDIEVTYKHSGKLVYLPDQYIKIEY